MTLDRLDSVVIGNRCEADGCECVAVTGQDRCYDHSVDRLIEALFVNEKCKFGGVNCEGNASRANEHDVLMCETCYDVYQRIQLGRANRRTIAIYEEQCASFMRGMLGIPPMRRDEGEETE